MPSGNWRATATQPEQADDGGQHEQAGQDQARPGIAQATHQAQKNRVQKLIHSLHRNRTVASIYARYKLFLLCLSNSIAVLYLLYYFFSGALKLDNFALSNDSSFVGYHLCVVYHFQVKWVLLPDGED